MPKGLVLILALSGAAAGDATVPIAESCVWPEDDFLRRHHKAVSAQSEDDLDGDGRADILVYDPGECGTGGCSYELYVSASGCWQHVGHLDFKMQTVKSTRHHGLRDITTVWRLGAKEVFEAQHWFDGRRYVELRPKVIRN